MLGMKRQVLEKSVIGTDMRVGGNCLFQGSLSIDGLVQGDVIAAEGAPSVLIIQQSGRVEGAIGADRIVVSGTVIGPVQAREQLELQATARIEGDVHYRSLQMEPGAVVAGKLQPQLTPPPAAPAAAPAADERAEPELHEPTEPTLDPERP